MFILCDNFTIKVVTHSLFTYIHKLVVVLAWH